MQVVACSPLTKIFLKEWEEQLLENPELIFDATLPFTFSVPRSTGDVANIHYGVPFRPDDFLRGTSAGKDPKEALNLAYFLSGGQDGAGMQETDWTGIVELDMGTSGTENALAMIHSKVMHAEISKDPKAIAKAKAEMDEMLKASYSRTQDLMASARKGADARVIRQLKTTHYNLMQQYKHNKDDGKGLYAPSTPEHFGAYVLRKLIQVSKGRQTMNADFNKLINEIYVQ